MKRDNEVYNKYLEFFDEPKNKKSLESNKKKGRKHLVVVAQIYYISSYAFCIIMYFRHLYFAVE